MLRSLIIGAALCIGGLATAAQSAEEIPKSGTVDIHSAFYFAGTVTQVGEEHMYADGPYWGVSFNNAGSGFLHNATWHCPGISELVAGRNITVGLCTITDGKRGVIHGTWGGGGPIGGGLEGKLKLTAGAGGYKGITGILDFSCNAVSEDGRQLSCKQNVSYMLP